MNKFDKQDKTRTLKDLSKVEETNPTKLTIETKCPKKWAFVDMETGDIWVHYSRKHQFVLDPLTPFKRADDSALEMVRRIADDNLIQELI